MEFTKGMVVRSLAGHDKGTFLVIKELDGKYAVICDGKRRKLENPKRKKLIHLSPSTMVVEEESMETNRAIRKLLSPFNGEADNQMT